MKRPRQRFTQDAIEVVAQFLVGRRLETPKDRKTHHSPDVNKGIGDPEPIPNGSMPN